MPAKKSPSAVREAAVLPTISASTFKATCLELMDEVAARHAEIVVTKHGRPIVKIGPVDATAPSPVGFLRGILTMHGDIASPDFAAWEMSDTDPIGSVKW